MFVLSLFLLVRILCLRKAIRRCDVNVFAVSLLLVVVVVVVVVVVGSQQSSTWMVYNVFGHVQVWDNGQHRNKI